MAKRQVANWSYLDFSSDSSSSSSSEDEGQEHKDASENEGDEKMDIDIDIDPENNQQHSKIKTVEPHPKTLIPEELASTSDDKTFQDYYVQLMTSEFSDDLDKLRQSKDFNEKSLYLLIQSLKEGAKMYSKDEAQIITPDSQ